MNFLITGISYMVFGAICLWVGFDMGRNSAMSEKKREHLENIIYKTQQNLCKIKEREKEEEREDNAYRVKVQKAFANNYFQYKNSKREEKVIGKI